ncbi:triose-phosphate transporter [Xylariales sp. AK1849]|nr:triose-phosphate transporter [Xylariales sp. AK1849]
MAGPILPTSSISEKQVDKRAGLSLHPGFYVGTWIFFSNLTILFNKWLINDAGFPVMLTFWHMAFASLATRFLALTTNLLDGRHKVKMSRGFYMRAVVPIGLLYSGSMVCSNLVYLYLNVAFIQMLKAAAPFSTLVIAWIWGQENPTSTVVLKILVIVFGVLLASAGEIHFSWMGFFYQMGGLVFESVRVVMIQALMSSSGMNMDPLVSLYFYAPVCAVMNLFVAWAAEWPIFQWSDIARTGFWMLFLNALIAFLLNVSSVLLIGKTSGLILHLTGVLKNILLVAASVLIWGTTIAPLQVLGYGVALSGFVLYRSSWAELRATFASFLPWYGDISRSQFSYQNQPPAFLRRVICTVVSFLVALVLLFSFTHGHDVQDQKSSVSSAVMEADQLSQGWLSRFGYSR